jgi:hypothetical protein
MTTHRFPRLPRPARTMLRLAALASLASGLAGCVGQPAADASAATGYGYTCYAGFYVCRLPAQYPVGAPCTCPGLGAPSHGTVR